jgi:hypothetical protein
MEVSRDEGFDVIKPTSPAAPQSVTPPAYDAYDVSDSPGLDRVGTNQGRTDAGLGQLEDTSNASNASDPDLQIQTVQSNAAGLPEEYSYTVTRPHSLLGAAILGVGIISYKGFLILASIILLLLLIAEFVKSSCDAGVGHIGHHHISHRNINHNMWTLPPAPEVLNTHVNHGIYLHQD